MLGAVVSCTIVNGTTPSSELPMLDKLRPCAVYCLLYTTLATMTFQLRTPDAGAPGVIPVYKLLDVVLDDTAVAIESIPATSDVWVMIPDQISRVLASGPWRFNGNAAEGGASPITLYVRYSPL